MTKDDNGEGMETKISTDPKTVKMFRRLEKFLDQEGIGSGRSINFQNAETGRVFAIFVSPDTFEAMESVINEQDKELELAQEIIDYLEDGNGLLDIIDAQNDVLQGRVIVDEVEGERGIGVISPREWEHLARKWEEELHLWETGQKVRLETIADGPPGPPREYDNVDRGFFAFTSDVAACSRGL
jgi:hypothetical protein